MTLFSDVGARNERRLSVINYNKTPGFEVIHGILDRIMQVVEVKYVGDEADKSNGYYIRAFDGKWRCDNIKLCSNQTLFYQMNHSWPEDVLKLSCETRWLA